MSRHVPTLVIRTAFDHAQQLLRKRKRLYLVSHETLQRLVDEMAEVARLLRRAEDSCAFQGIDRGVVKPVIDIVADESMPENEIRMGGVTMRFGNHPAIRAERKDADCYLSDEAERKDPEPHAPDWVCSDCGASGRGVHGDCPYAIAVAEEGAADDE